MTLAKDFEDFIKLLNKHTVQYMVVGGYALAFHGSPVIPVNCNCLFFSVGRIGCYTLICLPVGKLMSSP
jgi:hypothetical protein